MTEPALAHETDQYVTLGVDNEFFAVPVDMVREILDLRPIARLPNAPPSLLGMIDVRGQGVPVIDLRVKLGLAPLAPTEHSRIIVLDLLINDAERLLGMVADRVFEVTALAEQSQQAPPEIGVRWHSDYIRAIGRRNGAFVIIFDLPQLLTSEEPALMACEG